VTDTDVIVIGSGLSGLTSACLLAREGFRVEVFEKNEELGGYATTFQDRAGSMTFERSLSSLGGLNPGGPVRRNLELLGVMEDLRFVSPDYLFRAAYPEHDLKIPHSDVDEYVRTFAEAFPLEKDGLAAMVAEIVKVYAEYDRLQRNHFKDIYTNVTQYRSLIKYSKWTQARFLDQFLTDERLKTLVASQWGYLGMPPSRLPAMTFITFWMEYVFYGAHFPVPDCGAIVDGIVKQIERNGGRLHTGTRVRRILLEGGKAVGIELFGGSIVTAKTIIANVNPFVVIDKLVGPEHFPSAYVEKLNSLETSLSNLVIYLGLEKSVGDLFEVDAFEMVVSDRYDIEGMYRNCRLGRYEDVEIKLTLYDNLPVPKPDYGRITIDLYSGSSVWRGLSRAEEEDFKSRIYADVLRRLQPHLPDLDRHVIYKEISTPLDHFRYTLNKDGAIYGFEQNVQQAPKVRNLSATPIENLNLSSVWTFPGGGYSGAMWSGYFCVNENNLAEKMRARKPRPAEAAAVAAGMESGGVGA
jgi:all-trans-retinol 13,14-reductase